MADENVDIDYHGSPYISPAMRERVKHALTPRNGGGRTMIAR